MTFVRARFLPSEWVVAGCVYGWDGWFAKVDNVFLRLGGFAKVDNRFGYEKWLQGGSIGLALL
jgi:hypothetical protein